MIIAIELSILEELLAEYDRRKLVSGPAYLKAKKLVANYKEKIEKAKDPKNEN